MGQATPVVSKEKGWGANPASFVWRKKLNVGSLWKARTLIQSFLMKYGLLMDLFNKRQKTGKITMRQEYATFLSRRPGLSDRLECIYLKP